MRRILTLFSMLVVLEATAQTSHLTLDDAFSLGFERNPAIVATEYAEQAAHRKRQAAIGLFMPKISVKGAYTHLDKDIKINFNPMLSSFSPILGEGLAMLGLDLSYTLQHRNTAFLGGDVVMPIFAGGKIWTANRAAKIEEERTRQQSRQVHGALIVEIVERYFGVALARRGVAIREEAIAVVAQHLHDVAILEREGMAVESERLYAEYRLAEAERDLHRAHLQLETARKALQTSLGTTEVVEPSTPMFLLSKIEPLEYFVAMAELHNPQLGEVNRLRELARMNLRLHRADYFPEIAAMGGMVFCNHQLSPLVPRMAVGIGLNFKIFDGLNREYKAAAARLQLRRVEALEQKAEQDISLLVEDLYNKVQSVLATLSAVERSERFAKEFLRAKQRAFSEGMATVTDVVDATLNLSRARLEREQTAYDFDVALARLLNASGMGEAFMQYLHAPSAQSVF
ncbi:MAG: TolC family protein [Rikenellaceae bacterium]|nr:TolC family protein [Rikenellaceae bacterium]